MGRSLLLPKGNTLSGLEDLFWLLSRPSNKCGFLNKSMTNLAHPSSTGSASKAAKPILPTAAIFFIPPRFDEIFFRHSSPRNNIFPLRTVFYLITNHSIKTCIFWISFICIYFFLFFFSQQNFVKKQTLFAPHPSSFQNLK